MLAGEFWELKPTHPKVAGIEKQCSRGGFIIPEFPEIIVGFQHTWAILMGKSAKISNIVQYTMFLPSKAGKNFLILLIWSPFYLLWDWQRWKNDWRGGPVEFISATYLNIYLMSSRQKEIESIFKIWLSNLWLGNFNWVFLFVWHS